MTGSSARAPRTVPHPAGQDAMDAGPVRDGDAIGPARDGGNAGPVQDGGSAGPRSRALRRRDTEYRLAHDVDVWVATASADGVPYLVPLSFEWDGRTLLLATAAGGPTGRNLAAAGTVRLGLGPTRDVSMIDGDVEALEIDALPRERGDRFAARTGFDPRTPDPAGTPYRWFRVTPRRVQAWREADELTGRELMRDGGWLDRPDPDDTRATSPRPITSRPITPHRERHLP